MTVPVGPLHSLLNWRLRLMWELITAFLATSLFLPLSFPTSSWLSYGFLFVFCFLPVRKKISKISLAVLLREDFQRTWRLEEEQVQTCSVRFGIGKYLAGAEKHRVHRGFVVLWLYRLGTTGEEACRFDYARRQKEKRACCRKWSEGIMV